MELKYCTVRLDGGQISKDTWVDVSRPYGRRFAFQPEYALRVELKKNIVFAPGKHCDLIVIHQVVNGVRDRQITVIDMVKDPSSTAFADLYEELCYVVAQWSAMAQSQNQLKDSK